MRELPILFSAPMVRAILEGRKTVTRRVVDRVASLGPVTEFGRSDTAGYDWHCRDRRGLWNDMRDAEFIARCPYGRVGDRLWVRETAFRKPHPSDVGLTRADIPSTWDAACEAAGSVLYRADLSGAQAAAEIDGRRWKSPIHMPKAWARIWLEVTAVRVERLQDIDQAQAIVEGIDGEALFRAQGYAPLAFERLWESINGAGGWAANPWVWVVEFRRIPTGGIVSGGAGGLVGEDGCTSYLHELKTVNAGIS